MVEAFGKIMEYQRAPAACIAGLTMRLMWDRVVDCMLGAPVGTSHGELAMMTWTTAEKMVAIAK